MSNELTAEQAERIARIDAYRRSRTQSQLKQKRPDNVLRWFAFAVVLLLIAVGVAMVMDFSPGEQQAIYDAYRAQWHEAAKVVER